MTYALAYPLQQALFAALTANPDVATHFADRIHDAPPPHGAEAAGLTLVIGDEKAEDWSTATDAGAAHVVTLTIHAAQYSFLAAKQAAAAVSDLILAGGLILTRGRVVNARFIDAETKRSQNDAHRRIDLRFRLVLEDTA